MKDLSIRNLPRVAVSLGATSPNPGNAGALIWSLTTNSILSWDGSSWEELGSSVSVVFGTSPPGSPADGALWINTEDLSLNIFYNDGSSSQWVTISGPAGPQGDPGITVSSTAPSTPSVGDLWLDIS